LRARFAIGVAELGDYLVTGLLEQKFDDAFFDD